MFTSVKIACMLREIGREKDRQTETDTEREREGGEEGGEKGSEGGGGKRLIERKRERERRGRGVWITRVGPFCHDAIFLSTPKHLE